VLGGVRDVEAFQVVEDFLLHLRLSHWGSRL
jgi:hypothetical protein